MTQKDISSVRFSFLFLFFTLLFTLFGSTRKIKLASVGFRAHARCAYRIVLYRIVGNQRATFIVTQDVARSCSLAGDHLCVLRR